MHQILQVIDEIAETQNRKPTYFLPKNIKKNIKKNKKLISI